MDYKKIVLTCYNESDIEQKLVYPLLTSPPPLGFGFNSSEVRTKPDLRQLTIGKGKEQKLYYPDYIVILNGLPGLIVEEKGPEEELDQAFREARLYSNEINSKFPPSVNPAKRVLCVNGKGAWAGYSDSNEIKIQISIDSFDPSAKTFADLIDFCNREKLYFESDKISKEIKKTRFYCPRKNLGGQAVQKAEVGTNTFGDSLSLDYKHIFNPSSREERALIVRRAYIPSKRRERFAFPLDKIIRRAVALPSISNARVIEDVEKPYELVEVLRKERDKIENQVLLLIGNVGSGKSTFIDYMREVALPKDVIDQSVWVHLNMNNAPLSNNLIYDWICGQIVEGLKESNKDTDFDTLEMLNRIYSVELGQLKKGPLKLLPEGSQEYNTRLADKIINLQNDLLKTAIAFSRFCATERGKLLIIVFDNCDKRIRDEQLFMFQAAQWVRKEFRSLVVLPIRDETYDNHRDEPPLNTDLKNLVFRIEPPSFTKVLSARINLVLAEMSKNNSPQILSYILPNGIRVEYSSKDQINYLNAIYNSITTHDEFVRKIITGLAGRDLRRAMEIFLEFCTSGHIGEDEIFKIRESNGDYALPFEIIVRVLLRGNRRFYDGETGYIKNIFKCNPADLMPSYFTRLAVLRWLKTHFNEEGPTRVTGFHPVRRLKEDLNLIGFCDEVVDRELNFLLVARCIVAEHLRVEIDSEDDLIRLSPAGHTHLEFITNPSYLAAVSEETWYADQNIVERITSRISDIATHYTQLTTLLNAEELVLYLEKESQALLERNKSWRENLVEQEYLDISQVVSTIKAHVKNEIKSNPWFRIGDHCQIGQVITGKVVKVVDAGLIVQISDHLRGLLPHDEIKRINGRKPIPGNKIKVKAEEINQAKKKIKFQFESFS